MAHSAMQMLITVGAALWDHFEPDHLLGAIQILLDTLEGGGSQNVTKYHKGVGGLAKMSRDNFYW
jgi:hypothetical protein